MTSSSDLHISDVIRQAMEFRLSDLHTALPGRVESYNASSNKADVKPLIKKQYKDGQVDALPVIVNVPIIFPRTADSILSLPVKRGDLVLLVFVERSIDTWLSEGGDVVPNDFRKHQLSDAVAIPGLYPFSSAALNDANDVVLKFKNSEIRILANGNVDITATGAASINTAGDIKLDGGSSGKLAMGNSSAELLDLIDQILVGLETATVFTGDAGNQPLINAAIFTAIKTTLSQIKGSL